MLKRPLVWLAVGFAAAVLLLTIFSVTNTVLPVAALCVAALALLRLVPPVVRGRALVLCAAVVLAWGAVTLTHSRLAALEKLDGTQTPVLMTVLDEEEGQGYSMVTLYGRVMAGDKAKTVTVRAHSFETAGWQAGDRVEGVLSFTLPAEAENLRYLRSRGQFANAKVVSLQPLTKEVPLPTGPVVWGAKLNHLLSKGLTTALPGEMGAFVQSVLLGRREAVSDRVDEDMRRSGAAHIMVVSGLHLSLVCGGFVALLRRSGAGRWACFLAGAAACLLVMMIAGFSPSVTRGGIMMLLTLSADLARRRSDPFSSLAAAVVVMGIYNPYVLYSWSFLLSVGSMLSILVFVPRIHRGLIGWRRQRFPKGNFADPVLSVLSVSLGAMVYTYPMLSVMFGGVAVYGVVGNLLISPFVGLLMLLSGLTALLGAIGLGSGAAFAALPTGLLAGFCRGAARLVANLPGSWYPIDRRWQVVWLVGAALVLTLLVVLPNRSAQRTRLTLLALTLTLGAGILATALWQGSVVELHTFENSSSLVLVYKQQAVVVDADPEGARQAELLGKEQLLYTFGQNKAQQAALVLQEYTPQTAALYQDTAREISPYLSDQTRLMDLSQQIRAGEAFSITAGEGYTLIETDGLRVLKLLDGYAIIEAEGQPAAADFVVDAGGMIYSTAYPTEKPVRTLRFRLD